MTERALKCAVVGLGLGRHFTAALARNARIDTIVVCDPDSERSRPIVDEHPRIVCAYADLHKMLGSESLDLVCLVTPDHLHRAHAEACFASGCPVLQTKPLATNLVDARAIVKAAEVHGRKLMVAHERRFRPSVHRIKEIIENGDLKHVRIDAIQSKYGQFERAPWYASAEAGRNALNGTGIHEVDLAHHLANRPVLSASAFANRLGDLDFPKDKTTAAIFRFEDDVIGQVTITYEAKQSRGLAIDDHLRILGTKGSIFGNRAFREDQEAWEEIEADRNGIVRGIEECVEAFVGSVAEDTPVAVTGEDAFLSLVAVDTSASTGTTQTPEPLQITFA